MRSRHSNSGTLGRLREELEVRQWKVCNCEDEDRRSMADSSAGVRSNG